ncbi:MAG: hypothetical protein ABI472_25360, partial [Ginsengibacter sp.]
MINYKYNRYTRRGLFLLMVCGVQWLGVNAQVPAINKVEYYLDNDPGYGNGTNLSFSGTTNATATINLSITPLVAGAHIVGIRSRDTKGSWSLDNKWLFLKPYPNSG